MPSAHCGGAEKVFLNLLQHLPRDSYNPCLVLIENEGTLVDKIPRDVHFIPLTRKRVSRSLGLLLRTIRSINPDIVISSIFHLNIALLMLKFFFPSKTKVFVRESNLPSILLHREKYTYLFKLLIRFYYPKSDSVICLGEEMKKDLIDHFHVPSQKITNIGNPVDLVQVQRLSKAHQNPFDRSKFNFLAVGSLTPQKGFDILIDAVALISKQNLNIHLSIVGDGYLRNSLTDLIREKGLSQFISLCGFKGNPYPYFYYADRFILSSRYEGLPNAVLESLAVGTPVIAFDNPGCVRDIITKKEQGVLVYPCTAENLARKMIQACRIGSCLKPESLLPEKFLMDNVLHQYETLFTSV